VFVTYSSAPQVFQGVHAAALAVRLKLPLGHSAQPRGWDALPACAANCPALKSIYALLTVMLTELV
jgi:hypothetical protein